MKVLIVAAHPDDEVLGCGATIPKIARKTDNEVYTLILGDGITSRYSEDELDTTEVKEQVERINNCALEAGKILGVRETKTYRNLCCRFDTVPLLNIIKIIEREIERIQPQVIYTHWPHDVNIDHKKVYDAVLSATRPLPHSCVKTIFSFEVLSSTDWVFRSQFSPNVYENVEETLETKIRALQIYESEIREFPHPRSVEAIKTLARKRGTEVGINSAEAFELIRDVRGI